MRGKLFYAAVLVVALWTNSTFAQGYGAAVEQWRPVVDEACAVHGCSPDYVLGVMDCESGGDPYAVGPNGELGLMQIDPRYWGVMGPVEGIWFAAQHLTAGDIFWACA